MVDLFNIWNPHMIDNKHMVLDITPAEAALVRDGTPSFVSSCLQALGVAASPSRWTIRALRQSFYSDYLHSQDWRARWDVVWILDVVFSSPVTLCHPARVLPYRTDASDQSAKGFDEPPMDNCQALLLASFEPRETIDHEIEESILKWKGVEGFSSELSLTWLPHVGGRLLARGTVGPLKFPDSVEHLDSLLASWKQLGGLTNWHDFAANAN